MNVAHRKRSRPAAGSAQAVTWFFVLAFGWSWGIGHAAAAVRIEQPASSIALAVLSGFGPSLAAVAVVLMFEGRTGVRDWLARCLNRRFAVRWIALAFLTPPVVMLSALGTHILLGGDVPAPLLASQIPLAIAKFGLVALIGGPLGEEFGWRGYAMPALAARLRWRGASFLIGIVWGLWHLPLFYMIGTAQSQMPIPVFMVNILAGSMLFGWLFDRTNQSVLPAIVLHTSLNTWAGLLMIVPTAATARPYAVVTVLLVILALVVVFLPDRTMAGDRRR